MKKIISLFLTLIFVLSTVSFVFASENIILKGSIFATITKVIDAESFVVKIYGSKDTAMISLAGVDTKSNAKALEYATNKLNGQLVTLEFDTNVVSPKGRYNVMVMTCKEVNVNKYLIEKGFAEIKSDESNALFLSTNNVKQGIYNPNGTVSYYGQSGQYGINGVININTATSSQLKNALTGIDNVLADRIVDYRYRNRYFNTVNDIRNVSGITDTIFDNNKNKMDVVTNINAATKEELMTLKNFTAEDADKVIQSRTKIRFTSSEELYNRGLITREMYDLNKLYIDVNYRSSVYGYYENTYQGESIVNINTATRSQLFDALLGVNEETAQNIIDYRTNQKYFYNKSDLRNVKGITSEIYARNEYRIGVMTNLNNASRAELLTLKDITSEEADRIIDYRNRNRFIETKELYTKEIISNDKYKANEQFITVTAYNWDY